MEIKKDWDWKRTWMFFPSWERIWTLPLRPDDCLGLYVFDANGNLPLRLEFQHWNSKSRTRITKIIQAINSGSKADCGRWASDPENNLILRSSDTEQPAIHLKEPVGQGLTSKQKRDITDDFKTYILNSLNGKH